MASMANKEGLISRRPIGKKGMHVSTVVGKDGRINSFVGGFRWPSDKERDDSFDRKVAGRMNNKRMNNKRR